MGRRAVVPEQVRAVMAGGGRHCWTLAELQEGLGALGVVPDPSTVFRAVGRLEVSGVVRRVELDERRAHFELAGEHHEHLVCDGCGEVEAVPCALVVTWVEEVRRECGFEVSDHEVLLRGRCWRCRRPGRQP